MVSPVLVSEELEALEVHQELDKSGGSYFGVITESPRNSTDDSDTILQMEQTSVLECSITCLQYVECMVSIKIKKFSY